MSKRLVVHSNRKKILILVGEESGDLHGSHLIKELLNREDKAQIFAYGGRRMKDAGAKLIKNTMKTSVLGVTEVIQAIPELLKQEKEVKKWVSQNNPNLIIVIDYPGFHLKLLPYLSKWAPVHYYIPPKVWVWKKNRADKINKYCEKVYTIFPFEQKYYPKIGRYFGHPLVDIVKPEISKKDFYEKYNLTVNDIVIGLLPGSRNQELKKLLPEFLKSAKLLAKKVKNIHFFIPKVSTVDESLYEICKDYKTLKIHILDGMPYSIIANSKLVLLASGTVTLEATILGTPMLICYQTNWLTKKAFDLLSQTPHIGLPNIIAGKEIVKEFKQEDFTSEKIVSYSESLLKSDLAMEKQLERLKSVQVSLGDQGVIKKIADDMMEEL
ncbi:MAG: lipid-A-disaccharide synthase [Candidatus Cloacimonadota bacterium]|nr:MAG: lipid-A-disaccharide synthase [Candidatus Cloacimonadota bacterium]